LLLGKVDFVWILLIFASANRQTDSNSMQLDCSRNRSGQSTLDQFKTTAFNSVTVTCSIESSYFHAISTDFNKSKKLVRDHRVGPRHHF